MTCNIGKIQQGVLGNEGAIVGLEIEGSSPQCCDNGTMAIQRCSKVDTEFFKNFRTLEGQCNNKESPLYGSQGSPLSRLIPAEHSKFQRQTFFQKPTDARMLSISIIVLKDEIFKNFL